MSKTGKQRRSLKNLRLTEKYRFQYLGHWILICFLFLMLLNISIYAIYEQVWLNTAPAGLQFAAERSHHNMQVAGILIAISTFFGMAILLLAIFTAHRIGGPYIALKRTMFAIQTGNLNRRLHFRTYDKLDDVEAAFNEMMDVVQSRVEAAEATRPKGCIGEPTGSTSRGKSAESTESACEMSVSAS